MTTLTGNGIRLFKWLAARSAIKMEMAGLRSRSFKIIRPRMLKELGLPPRSRLPAMLEVVEKKIKECEDNLKPGEIVP